MGVVMQTGRVQGKEAEAVKRSEFFEPAGAAPSAGHHQPEFSMRCRWLIYFWLKNASLTTRF